MKNKMRKDEQEKKRQARERHRKRWAYLVIVGVTIAGAGWLVVPALWSEKPNAVGGDVVEIKGTMGGFSTSLIRAKAGRPLTVRLTSVDNRFHTDGGGKHQFAVDALGVNIIAPPLGTREATFTPKEPGVYEYYCDICCGGRANPTMVGKLIVEA
jgi:heme/copper-type cytochrome/quinol oxidase subunit 2